MLLLPLVLGYAVYEVDVDVLHKGSRVRHYLIKRFQFV